MMVRMGEESGINGCWWVLILQLLWMVVCAHLLIATGIASRRG